MAGPKLRWGLPAVKGQPQHAPQWRTLCRGLNGGEEGRGGWGAPRKKRSLAARGLARWPLRVRLEGAGLGVADVRKCLPRSPPTLCPCPPGEPATQQHRTPFPEKWGPLSGVGNGWAGPGEALECLRAGVWGSPDSHAVLSAETSAQSQKLSHFPSSGPGAPALRQNQYAHSADSVPLKPAQRPRQRPLTAAEQWGEEKGWMGRLWALSFPCPWPTKQVNGQGRGVRFPRRSVPPAPHKEPQPPGPGAWHLIWVLQSWAGPGPRTCEP